MKPKLLITLFFAICSCSGRPGTIAVSSETTSETAYTFKPYCAPKVVYHSSVKAAFVHLKEQGDERFVASSYNSVSDRLHFEDTYEYKGKSIKVSLYDDCRAGEEEISVSAFVGKYYVDDKAFLINVTPLCGLWGDGDFKECFANAKTIKKSGTGSYHGCGETITIFELVYPMVYCDRANYQYVDEDITEFLTISLFDNMMIPLEKAMEEIEVYADCLRVMTCAAGPEEESQPPK